MVKIVPLLFTALYALFGLSCSESTVPAAPAETVKKDLTATVHCRVVTSQIIAQPIVGRGTIVPPMADGAMLASLSPGRIAAISVVPGQHVTAGQLLVTIEDPQLRASVSQASAESRAAQASLVAATAQVQRAERLAQQGIGARRDVEDAVVAAAAARGRFEVARASSSLASAQSGRAQIRATRSGTVLRVLRHVGEVVDGTSASAVIEFAHLAGLEVDVEIAGAEMQQVGVGAKAYVVLSAREGVAELQELQGTVIFVAPTLDPDTAMGHVRVALAAVVPAALTQTTLPSSSIPVPIINETATVSIDGMTRRVALVPRTALRRSELGELEVVTCAAVATRERRFRAHAQAVTVWRELGAMVAVDGLTMPTQVVVDRALGIEDDTALESFEPGTPAQ